MRFEAGVVRVVLSIWRVMDREGWIGLRGVGLLEQGGDVKHGTLASPPAGEMDDGAGDVRWIWHVFGRRSDQAAQIRQGGSLKLADSLSVLADETFTHETSLRWLSTPNLISAHDPSLYYSLIASQLFAAYPY